jgi:hypothetical protein
MQTKTVMDALVENSTKGNLTFKNENILDSGFVGADGSRQSCRPAANDYNIPVVHMSSLEQVFVKADQICRFFAGFDYFPQIFA